jgi:5'-deoxynucleotidase YfbR-like HD superfamily hydrolase
MAQITKLEQVLAIREGGGVKRLHTVPTLRDYLVSSHSWTMVTLLLLLHPKPTVRLIQAVQFHDVFERWVGDIPAPAKYWINPDLGREARETERRVEQILDIGQELTKDEVRWLKALDFLELLMWCDEELSLGNTSIEPVRTNIRRLMTQVELPDEVAEFMKTYEWKRSESMDWWKELTNE